MNWDRPIIRDLFWFWALPQRFARWLEAERRRLQAMIDTADAAPTPRPESLETGRRTGDVDGSV